MRKILILLLMAFASVLLWSQTGLAARDTVVVDVTVRRFEFTPSEIRVRQGDTVRINLTAEDVTHGWHLDGYDLNLEDRAKDRKVDSLEFVADKAGRFAYRCSVTCGPMHPFLVGTLIVEPNNTFPGALGLSIVMGIGSVVLFTRRGRLLPAVDSSAGSRSVFSLTQRWPWFKTLLRQRWFQYALMAPNLAFFAVILYAGFVGTPVGNANFAILFVWMIWWVVLIAIFFPFFGGRLWCTMCPLPAPGEWLDRRSFIFKGRERPFQLALKGWPKRLRNIWAQNLSFLLVCLFAGIILTRPIATAAVLSAFIVLAVVFSLKYGKRIFCRYLCPVGGFIGLYSMVAPFELRVRDKEICRQHKEKDCINGNANGYGCPWLEVPWNLERNAYCGLCTECLKTCPKDNITVNARPFGSDLLTKKHRSLDENYKAFIMLTCAIAYSAVFLGPWGFFKDWVNLMMPGFAVYTVGFLAANLIVTPGLFALAVWLGRGWAAGKFENGRFLLTPFVDIVGVSRLLLGKDKGSQTEAPQVEKHSGGLPSLRQIFTDLAYTLVPMGLAGWIAFSLSFLAINVSYAVKVISDPFGWGWNLFGTAGVHWQPYLMTQMPYVVTLIMLAGLALSICLGYKLVRQYSLPEDASLRLLIPVAGLLTGITALFLWLYV